MDSKKVEIEICKRMRNFEETITVSSGYDSAIIKNIFNKNQRLLFYVANFKIKKAINSSFQVETKLQIHYHNRDFDLEDVYVVSTITDILSLVSRYIGNYKTKLGLILDANLDIEMAFNEFKDKYAVLYPNFIQTKINGYTYAGKAIYKFYFIYRIGRVKLNMMESEIQTEVERISKLLFKSYMPSEAKIYLAHNYLATTVTYYGTGDISTLERSYVQSAYGALITKKCVCQGIAEAFKRLMDKAAVTCDVVCGQIIGRDDYHAWNIVRLSSTECFHVDVTWDIASNSSSYLYFGKNDAFLERTRRWNRLYNVKCMPRNNLFMLARKYIVANKQNLLQQGISAKILGV